MYRLVIIILMSVSAAYSMDNMKCVNSLFQEIQLERPFPFITEMCSKLGEVLDKICPAALNNPSEHQCRYSPYCAINQSAALLSFDIIHHPSKRIVCAFKYNTLTQELTLDDNPNFLWKIEYKS